VPALGEKPGGGERRRKRGELFASSLRAFVMLGRGRKRKIHEGGGRSPTITRRN